MDIKCTKPPAEIIVLFLLRCSCTCPKWGKQKKAQDKLRHSTEVQESRTSTFWQTKFEQKKTVVWVIQWEGKLQEFRGGEGLFTWTKWHEDMFDIQEVNGNHYPKRYKSFLLEVLQSKALTQSTRSHRDWSAQHMLQLAWQKQGGLSAGLTSIVTHPFGPLLNGKGCQHPRMKESGTNSSHANQVKSLQTQQGFRYSPFQTLNLRDHWGIPCTAHTAETTEQTH